MSQRSQCGMCFETSGCSSSFQELTAPSRMNTRRLLLLVPLSQILHSSQNLYTLLSLAHAHSIANSPWYYPSVCGRECGCCTAITELPLISPHYLIIWYTCTHAYFMHKEIILWLNHKIIFGSIKMNIPTVHIVTICVHTRTLRVLI